MIVSSSKGDERTQYRSIHLRQEHDSGRNLEILSHFQITGKIDRSGDNIVAPHRELGQSSVNEDGDCSDIPNLHSRRDSLQGDQDL